MARTTLAVAVTLALACGAVAQLTLPTGADSTLDQCQVILGSQALGDGTFDRDTDFMAFIEDGTWSVPLSSILNSTGDVLYVVPASKADTVDPITVSNRKSAGYCYDTSTLLPQYNPLAVSIPSDANDTINNVVVNPLTTVLVFGTAYGLTEFTLDMAFGLDYTLDVSSYDFITEYQNDPNGEAGTYWKESTKIGDIVTVGASLLANTTDSYASFAVLMYQALGRKALNASSVIWNAHLNNGSEPALALNDPTTVAAIFVDAARNVHSTKDWLLPQQLNSLSQEQYLAAATAVVNLNMLTDAATNSSAFAKADYYSSETLAPMVMDLASGTMDPTAFADMTTSDSIAYSLSKIELPSSNTTGSGGKFNGSDTQSSTDSSSSSGMSGGAIAGTVIGVVAGVAIIALVAAFLVKRRNSSSGAPTQPSTGPRSFWRRDQEPMESTV